VPEAKIRILFAASFALATLAGCAAPADSATDPAVGESQDHLLAGRRLSESEAATLIRDAGFPESQVGRMLCTIKYESSFYERASNHNNNGSYDYGLFQVNSLHIGSAGCPSSASGLYDAATNTECAYRIFKSQGNNAWYGYQKHRSECDRYPAPGASSSSSSTGSSSGSGSAAPAPAADGGCYSGTLGEMVDALTCVESKYGTGWFQCRNGTWYSGGDTGRGPFGTCKSSHPL
jgi:hypothetical protein